MTKTGRDREPSSSPRGALICAGVFLAAFLVRLVYLLEYSRTPYWDALALDPQSHFRLASALARGEGMGPCPFFRAPLYIWLLAGFVRLFGDNLWPVRIFQALLGSGTAALTAKIALSRLKPTWALASGLMIAFLWTAVYFDGELLIAGLAAFLAALSLLLLMDADDRRRERGAASRARFLAAGIAAGMAAIARPNFLAFGLIVPSVIAARGFWERARKRGGEAEHAAASRTRALSPAAFFLAGVLGCMLPVTARNLAVAHDFVLIASQGGINFWLGNHQAADGRTVVVPFPRREIPLSFIKSRKDHPWVMEDVWLSSAYGAEQALAKRVKDSEISRYWFRESFKWMKENPGAAARLFLKKLLYLFQAKEVSNNRDLEDHRRKMLTLRILSVLHFGLLSPLMAMGLALALRKPGRWAWPLLFFFTYGVSVAAFFVTSRYRVPLFPAGMVFCGLCLQELAASARALRSAGRTGEVSARAKTRLASLAAGLVVFAVLFNADWPRWNQRPLLSAMHYNLGIGLLEKGRLEAAEAEFQKSLQIKSPYPEARFYLAEVHARKGELRAAAKDLETALSEDPYFAAAHYRLSLVYARLAKKRPGEGYEEKARKHAAAAYALAPEVFGR